MIRTTRRGCEPRVERAFKSGAAAFPKWVVCAEFHLLGEPGGLQCGGVHVLHIKGFDDELGLYFSGREEQGTEA